jgi:hypothetical protein
VDTVTTYCISISGLLAFTAGVGWLRSRLIDDIERGMPRSVSDEAADWLRLTSR